MKNISDEQFRDYFLGKLHEAESEIFEMECAADRELTGQAQTVENELADDFLRGNLTAADAALFEANYLTTDARRAKLRVASGLWQFARAEKSKSSAVAAAAAAAAATAPNSFWQTFFGGNNLKLVSAGLILLFVCGAIVFYLLNLSAANRQIAEVKVANLPAEPQNPPIQNPAPEVQTPEIDATEKTAVQNKDIDRNLNSPQKNQPAQKIAPPAKKAGQNQTGLAIFALLPETLRSAGEQFIAIAPSAKNLGLRLKLPEDAGKYRIYRAVVKTAEGDSVFSEPNLKSLYLTIPSEKFENRTYIIFLEGKNAAGEFESITEYSFRVRR